MAQQLRLTDRPLDRVIMIDSFIPEKMIESQKRGSIFWFLKDIESSCKTSFSISLEEVKNLGETELLSKILNSLAAATSNTKSQTTELVKNLILNYYRLRNLANNYKPTQFNGRAFLLQADENQENQEPARDTNGWQGLVQELLTFKVPGNHFSIVKGENARVLATKIKSLLSS